MLPGTTDREVLEQEATHLEGVARELDGGAPGPGPTPIAPLEALQAVRPGSVALAPFGVLGWQRCFDGTSRVVAQEPGDDVVPVDPAGLAHIQQSGPSGAGGASGELYRWLGIDGDPAFPADVRAGLTRQGAAFAHTYPAGTVIHTVGPDLRSSVPGSNARGEAVAALTEVYSSVLLAAAALPCAEVRIPPVSTGVFAGSMREMMPGITALALDRAFAALDDAQSRTLASRRVRLCIFEEAHLSSYRDALGNLVDGAAVMPAVGPTQPIAVATQDPTPFADPGPPPTAGVDDAELLAAADAFVRGEGRRRLRDSDEGEAPAEGAAVQRPRHFGGEAPERRVVLVAFYAGLGNDILGMHEYLEERQLPDHLHRVYIVEVQPRLANAVQQYWRDRAAARGAAPCEILTLDGWNLFRQGAGLLCRLADSLPRNSLTLLSGGSPCQQMTQMGAGQGYIGLCGRDSVNFFMLPIAAHFLSLLREDVYVDVAVETASQTRGPHARGMEECLGLRPGESIIRSTEHYGVQARRRLLMTTMIRAAGYDPPNYPSPWEVGWHVKCHKYCTLMRKRPGPSGWFKVSSHQAEPQWLVWHSEDFENLTLEASRRLLRERLAVSAPAEVVTAYDLLVRTQLRAPSRAERDAIEAQVQPYVDWICQYGRSVGARTPTLAERAAIFGLYELIDRMLAQRPHDITEEEAFDAIGNSFDRRMWLELVGVPVDRFCRGAPHPRRSYPGVGTVLRVFQRLHEYAAVNGHTPHVDSPFPRDLADLPSWADGFLASRRQTRGQLLVLRDAEAGGYPAGALAPLPPGYVLTAGESGGIGDDARHRNVCVIDSILQVFGFPRARDCRAQAELVASLAHEVRVVCRIPAGGIIPIAEAWAYLATMRYGVFSPRSHLVELNVDNLGLYRGSQISWHGSRGPWDGRIAAVATGNNHTVPVWWHADSSANPAVNVAVRQVPVPDNVGRADVMIPPRFSLPPLAATGLGYRFCEAHEWPRSEGGRDLFLQRVEVQPETTIPAGAPEAVYTLFHRHRRVGPEGRPTHSFIGFPHDPHHVTLRHLTGVHPHHWAAGVAPSDSPGAPAALVVFGPSEWAQPLLICEPRRDHLLVALRDGTPLTPVAAGPTRAA